jgi:hypothetical protein
LDCGSIEGKIKFCAMYSRWLRDYLMLFLCMVKLTKFQLTCVIPLLSPLGTC